MKPILLFGSLLSIISLISCNKKNEPFTPVAGSIPAEIIQIRDSSFYPEIDTIALGAHIAFNNITTTTHRIISADSSTILTPDIAPGSKYTFYVADTGAIYYHCVQHPSVEGMIYIRP